MHFPRRAFMQCFEAPKQNHRNINHAFRSHRWILYKKQMFLIENSLCCAALHLSQYAHYKTGRWSQTSPTLLRRFWPDYWIHWVLQFLFPSFPLHPEALTPRPAQNKALTLDMRWRGLSANASEHGHLTASAFQFKWRSHCPASPNNFYFALHDQNTSCNSEVFFFFSVWCWGFQLDSSDVQWWSVHQQFIHAEQTGVAAYGCGHLTSSAF